MRPQRSWALARSACSEARLTPGPTPGSVGWLGFQGVELGEQVAVAVEERAVDIGAAGDRREADLLTSARGLVDALSTRWRRRAESARRPSTMLLVDVLAVLTRGAPGGRRVGAGAGGASRA